MRKGLIISVIWCLLAVLQVSGQSPEEAAAMAGRVRAARGGERTIEQAYSMGMSLVRAGSYGEALEIFTAISEVRPSDRMARYFAALSLFNLGRAAESERAGASAVALARAEHQAGPDDEGRRTALADALTLHAVILAVLKRNPEALVELQEAVRLAPGSFDARFSLGRAYFGQGDMPAAAESFEVAARLRPGDVRARFFLATALERSGNLQAATAAYREMTRLAPGSSEGHLGLGALLVKRQETLEEGIASLVRAVELNGEAYESRVALGRALIAGGKPSESIQQLQKAAILMPANPEPHYQLSIAYRKLGRSAEAAEELKIVQRLNEEHRKRSRTAASTVDKP